MTPRSATRPPTWSMALGHRVCDFGHDQLFQPAQLGSGNLSLPSNARRYADGIISPTRSAYSSYLIVFPAVKNTPSTATLTQIADVILAGWQLFPTRRARLALIVTTNTDVMASDGKISLREAVDNANANADQSAITFDATAFGTSKTIALASALPQITTPVTITGSPAGVTLDDATKQLRLIAVSSSGNLNVAGLTFTRGAGLYNSGTATISNSTFSNSGGDGLTNDGTATVINSTICRP